MRQVGKYELLDVLGKGGMGEVWRARDTELDRIVALKLLQRTDAEDLARFKREAHVVAQLSHPNIASLYEFSADPPYLAMQYIEGGPISEAKDKVAALRDAARAVHFAHQRGILHRDLKPANIMVDGGGRASVLDFGLARETRSDTTAMTLSGDILGTPCYMAPEQARGEVKNLDARTDVYGLGATLYSLIAGRPPHEGATAFDIVHSVIHNDPKPPGGRRDLETIALKALEKEPRRRYASAAEFADDLERFLHNEPIAARPASTWYRLRKKIQRQPYLWGLTALVLVLVGFGALQIVRRSQKEHEANQNLDRARRETESRAKLAASQALVDEAQALLADVKASLYVKGCTLGSHAARIATAREKCDKALKLWPDYGPAWYVIGATRRAAGEPDEAVRALRRATQSREAAPHMWAELGRALFESALMRSLRESSGPSMAQIMKAAAREAETCFNRAGHFGDGIDSALVDVYRLWLDHKGLDLAGREVVARFGDTPGVEEAWFLLGVNAEGDEAIARYTRAIEIRPGYALALFQRGNVYDDRRDYRRAIQDYDEAIRVKPDFVEAYNNRSNARDGAGDLTGAVEDVTYALRFATVNAAELRASRGLMYNKMNEPRLAIEDFDEAIRLNPDLRRALSGRAAAHRLLGEFQRAVDDLGRAIALDPHNVALHINRGLAYHDLGEYRRAIEDYDESIRLEASCVEAYNNRGLSYLKLREYRRAIEDFDAAIRLRPDEARPYENRARAHGSLREYDLAIADYTRALELDPDHLQTLNDRGFAYGRTGDMDRANADFAEALRRKPEFPEVYANRGYLSWKRGDLDEARADLTRALELAPAGWRSRPTVEGWLREIDKKTAPSDSDY